MKQGMGQTGKAALDEVHTLKEDLSTSDSKTTKQREIKATCNSKRRGKLVMCIHNTALTNKNLTSYLRTISWST